MVGVRFLDQSSSCMHSWARSDFFLLLLHPWMFVRSTWLCFFFLFFLLLSSASNRLITSLHPKMQLNYHACFACDREVCISLKKTTQPLNKRLFGRKKKKWRPHIKRENYLTPLLYIYVCLQLFWMLPRSNRRGTEQNNDVRQSASVCFVVLVLIIYYHYYIR